MTAAARFVAVFALALGATASYTYSTLRLAVTLFGHGTAVLTLAAIAGGAAGGLAAVAIICGTCNHWSDSHA